MSPVRLIILLVAAGAAIGAVFLVRSLSQPAPAVAASTMTPAEAAKVKEVPSKQVLVANHAIPVGKFVAADDLRWAAWPEAAPTSAFIEQEKQPEALEKLVGAVARFDLVEGEPVTAIKVVHPGTAGFMAVMLTPGMRAASVEIASESAAGGFIQPNDRVDVIVTREIEGQKGTQANTMQNVRSDLILANVRVLAIDDRYGPPPADTPEAQAGQGMVIIGTRATLELTQSDATLLNTAKKAGDISLTLRSIADAQSPQGSTPTGRVYRDGVAQTSEGVRVYRYGTESVAAAPAG